MAHSELTRRALLHWLLLLGAGLPSARTWARDDPPTVESKASLLNLLRFPKSAALVGEEYLRLRPEENDERRLSESLGLSNVRLVSLRESDLAMVRHQLMCRQKLDFRRGEVVDFHGWILSASELRICALVYLYSGG